MSHEPEETGNKPNNKCGIVARILDELIYTSPYKESCFHTRCTTSKESTKEEFRICADLPFSTPSFGAWPHSPSKIDATVAKYLVVFNV